MTFDRILTAVAQGISLSKACKEYDIHVEEFYRLLRKDALGNEEKRADSLVARYRRARVRGIDFVAARMLAVADDAGLKVAVKANAIDRAKWYATMFSRSRILRHRES